MHCEDTCQDSKCRNPLVNKSFAKLIHLETMNFILKSLSSLKSGSRGFCRRKGGKTEKAAAVLGRRHETFDLDDHDDDQDDDDHYHDHDHDDYCRVDKDKLRARAVAGACGNARRRRITRLAIIIIFAMVIIIFIIIF